MKNKIGETPLIAAVEGGHSEMIKVLIQAGVELNARDWHGTALIWAIELGKIEVLGLLINAGAEINTQDSEGIIALSRAIQMKQAENAGADPSYKFTKIIKMLLDAGTAPHAVSIDGTTALMEASNLKDYEIAQMLIAAGAKVNAVDTKGQTALIMAVPRIACYYLINSCSFSKMSWTSTTD